MKYLLEANITKMYITIFKDLFHIIEKHPV